MNDNLNLAIKSFNKKNVQIFQVENTETFKLIDIIIFAIFFIIIPILWVAIRAISFPTYSLNMMDFINNNVALTYENQVIYTVSLIGFQIFLPIVGIFVLSFRLKYKIFSSGLYILFLIYPIKLLLSLILASFTNSIDGLNTFLIDFVYSLLIVIFAFIKNKNIRNMFKLSYNNYWKFVFFIAFFTLLYFALLYFMFFITSLFKTGNDAGNQTIIQNSLSTPFSIVAVFFSVVIVAPIIEEIIYRMVLADIFKNRWYSYLTTTFFFAFLHIQSIGDWENILPYLSLGLINGFVYWKFKNISIPILVHFLGNVVGFILLFATK
ncbi:MAG: type II CAAX endopeptidase family protein [Malacoplasma sp.]